MTNELPSIYKRVLGFACNNNVLWQITGFKLQGSDTVRISFSINDACNVFGCYQSADATDNYDLYASVSSGSKYLRYGNGTYLSYFSNNDLGKRFNVVFTPTGTQGMPQDSTWTAATFTSANDLLIAATTITGTSAKLKGNLYGNFVVDGRLNCIPCERISDGVLGYYDTYSETFFEPTGTPASLGYATTIQLRHDTAANWTSVNPILLEGEVGIETDTRKQKFGDGVTAWNRLPYDKGSTALQSITSSNVTTALGYTPVNKAGDTMAGGLSTTYLTTSGDINLGGSGRMNLKVNDTSKGTTPSSNRYQAFLFNDTDSTHTTWQDMRFGACEVQVLNTGENRLILSAYKNEANSTAAATLTLGMPSRGNAWCTFPNTTCVDGQWVDSFHTLSTSTAQGNYEIDVSSFLPSDRTSYDYEIMVHFTGSRTSGSTNTYVTISKSLLNITLDENWKNASVYGSANFDGDHGEAQSISCIVIARKNVDKFYFNITRQNLNNSALVMTKYRRIGTNA